MGQSDRQVEHLRDILGERYEFEAFLGRGGSASVYRVRNVRLERLEALKVLTEPARDDPDFATRFTQEAKVAAALDHPSIIKIYDFGQAEDVFWYSMQYVEGPSLAAELAARDVFDAASTARLMAPLLDALDYSHQQGVVHRDIKPANIILDPRGRPYLMDFGIAKSAGSMLKTRTGLVLGTPAYVSPEQASGEKLDGRSDLYSIGITMYQMLVGHYPFKAKNPLQTVVMRLTQDPEQLAGLRPDLDPDFAAVVMKALERERDQRHASAGEMRDALVRFCGEVDTDSGITLVSDRQRSIQIPAVVPASGSAPTMVDPRRRAVRRARRVRLWTAATLAAAAVAITIWGVTLLGGRDAEGPTGTGATRSEIRIERTRPEVDATGPADGGADIGPPVAADIGSAPAEAEAATPETSAASARQEARQVEPVRRAVTRPALLEQVEPQVPGRLAEICSGQKVSFSVVVGEDGLVQVSSVISKDHPPECTQPATDAVHRYLFQPAVDGEGRPVAAKIAFSLVFPEVESASTQR